MGEAHNNTVPAKRGSYNISKAGIVYYFPVQDPGYLRPFMALVMMLRADGEIFCAIDERWGPLEGLDATEP